GILLPRAGLEEVVEAVRTVHLGQTYLPDGVRAQLADRSGQRRLTMREREVLSLMSEGWSNAQIAKALGIAAGTIKIHAKPTFDKLGADGRTQAAAIAIRRGFVRLAV